MDIDLILLKRISILSAFFGAILGFITLIPFIGTFSLVFLLCFIAPLVIWILIKYNCLSLSSIKDSIIVGAIAGAVSYLGFSIIYIPISVVLMKLFHISANYGIGLILVNANFFILVVLSLFMSVLGATVNAFTGFLTFYIIELLNSIERK
jgi:hypothetical protein